MAIPRILFAVPLLVAGAFLPAAGADPVKAPSGTVGMDHEVFTSDMVTIRRGETLTLVNDSRWAHIIGPGRDGSLAEADRNPMREPFSPRPTTVIRRSRGPCPAPTT